MEVWLSIVYQKAIFTLLWKTKKNASIYNFKLKTKQFQYTINETLKNELNNIYFLFKITLIVTIIDTVNFNW